MARELALTGRMFDATEAEKIGFVSRVVNGGREEVEKEAVKMAALIASKSPIAVLGTKKVMNCERVVLCSTVSVDANLMRNRRFTRPFVSNRG
jgi:enoyl-CoA hydratase/carnithine racemase